MLTSSENKEDKRLYDLLQKQYVLRRIVEPLFKNVDFGVDAVATRWGPAGRNRSVLLDPQRSFGKPIVATAGVPTEVVAMTYDQLGSSAEVAGWYDLSPHEVKHALDFERRLQAALFQ
ncbi:MAG: DUF433 domain-containing protein [Alphaproteobacteria bacterium]